MMDFGASAAPGAVIALIAISFFSFVAGFALRKWPEKAARYAEDIDGSFLLFTPETHRLVIEAAGVALSVLSLTALVAAGLAG